MYGNEHKKVMKGNKSNKDFYKDYVTIQRWMREKPYELKGVELITYAVIYSFSRDGNSKYTGNLKYLSDWSGVSKSTIQRTIESLVKKGMICKKSMIKNNITFCEYSAISNLEHHTQNEYAHTQNEYAHTQNEHGSVPKIGTNKDLYKDLYKDHILRSDENSFSSPEPEIIEEYPEEKKKQETLFDIPIKQQEEKQRKNSAKKKDPTLTHKMRLSFESYYKSEKKEEYYYTAKDGTALKGISAKLKSTIRNKHGSAYNPSDKEMIESFEYILSNLKSSNNWIYNNLDISKINSQYNQIIANIKSGSNGQTRNGKGATNEEVAEILKKYDII